MNNKNYFQISLFYILLLISVNLFAQDNKSNFINPKLKNYGLITQNWNIDSGLQRNRILDIGSDEFGFIWIGTDNGLVRFDGKVFKIYNNYNTDVIKDRTVTNFSFAPDKSFWFKNGLRNLINMNDRKFSTIDYRNLKVEIIHCIASDLSNKLWVGTISNGLFYLENNKLVKFTKNIYAENISSIVVDKKNNIWVGTKGYGIYKINGSKVVDKIMLPFFKLNRIKTLYVDSKKRIWAGTNNGLALIDYNKSTKNYSIQKITSYRVNSIIEDKNNNIWIATNKYGILIRQNKKLLRFSTQNGLSDNNVTSLLEGENGIWVGTFKGGLNYIRKAQVFTVSSNQGLTSTYVNALYEDYDGSLLIGTNIGLYKLKNPFVSEKVTKLNILNDNHIFSIARDNENNLVIGTRYNGLYVFQKNRTINYTTSNGLKSNFVRTVFFDDDNRMWVGANGGGVSVFSSNGIKSFTRENGLSSELISFIHKSRKGQYWIGTSSGGVNIIDSGRVVKILNDKNGLSGNIISSIYEETDGTIWLTINGGGLTLIRKNIISNLNIHDGLYSDKLLNITPDSLGQLWFSTPKGIFSVKKNNILRYLKREDTKIYYQFFGEADGMLNDRCVGASPQTSITTSKGIVCFSTLNGIVNVYPSLIDKRETKIKVYIDEVLINYKVKSLSDISSIKPGAERVEFKFGAIDFANPNELEFIYKMSGLQNKWIRIGKQRTISYSHLSYGQYKFFVKAVNRGINKESNLAEVSFYLEPFFYQTIYFKILISLFLLGLIIGLTRYFYLRKYKQELMLIELENVIEKERMRISKDMHDDIGSVLTKINLLSEIAKRDIADKSKLTDELNQINAAGREVIDTLDEIVWALNPKNDNIENLISYIVMFAEDYLGLAGIDLKLSVPEEIPDVEIRAELRHNLFMVIKETLNNTVKYSGTKCVNIPIEITNSKLVIEVKNEGKKINFDNLNKFSNGIKNMKSRINEIGGEYVIENLDKGVRTKIILNY